MHSVFGIESTMRRQAEDKPSRVSGQTLRLSCLRLLELHSYLFTCSFVRLFVLSFILWLGTRSQLGGSGAYL